MAKQIKRSRVLFICTHNAVRSQMAEGWLRHLYGSRHEVYSAGTDPGGVHPLAIRVMGEIGIDLSGHRSKGVDELPGIDFDVVVTVCDDARESCPSFSGGGEHIHQSFRDPSREVGDLDEQLKAFREVRDEIGSWIGRRFGGGR